MVQRDGDHATLFLGVACESHGGAYWIEEVGRCWYCGRLSAGGRFTNVDSQLVVQKYKLSVGHNWSATDCRFAT